MPTTQQGPMKVNDLINQLKLLPGEWALQISTDTGERYITGLLVNDNCNVELLTEEIPNE